MSQRDLDFGWNEIARRLETDYTAQVVAAIAVVTDEGVHQPVAFTMRGGKDLTPFDHTYGRLQIVRRSVQPDEAAAILRTGQFGPVNIPVPPAGDGSRAMWLTQAAEYGLIAPTTIPRLYHSYSWPTSNAYVNDGQPLARRGSPYYSTTRAALLEILYGRTDAHMGYRPVHHTEVSLAYDTAYLGEVDYLEAQGLVVNVSASEADRAADHELQVAWLLHRSDTERQQWSETLDAAGTSIVPIPVAPLSYSVALLDQSGTLVDYLDGQVRPVQQNVVTLPPTAIPEAFDFLDSAWRNLFGRGLVDRPLLSGVADLSQPVTSRADFAARMTHLADLMKSLRIDDKLLGPGAAKTNRDASLVRMRQALRQVLNGPDVVAANQALQTLSAANDVRVALQHKLSQRSRVPDLSVALTRLGIDYPPTSWSDAWDAVVERVVTALGQIRRVALANLPHDIS